jgi:hypothetical protein
MTTYCNYTAWDVVPREKMKVTIASDYSWSGEAWQKRVKVTNAPVERTMEVKLQQSAMTERRALRDFFDACQGSLTPFWIPSYKHDMTIAASCPIGTGTIYVENNSEIFGLYDLSRHVYAPDSTQRFKISSPVKQDDGSVALTISPVLTAALAAGDQLQWLFLVRFNDDALKIETAEYNESITFSSFKLRELQRETP